MPPPFIWPLSGDVAASAAKGRLEGVEVGTSEGVEEGISDGADDGALVGVDDGLCESVVEGRSEGTSDFFIGGGGIFPSPSCHPWISLEPPFYPLRFYDEHPIIPGASLSLVLPLKCELAFLTFFAS
jgi:hypothetical protein